jgi:endonuclease YncB( thermonuclease family)
MPARQMKAVMPYRFDGTRCLARILAAFTLFTANTVALVAASAETVDGLGVVIVDGDTVHLAATREKVRLLDIDAPETFRSHCEAELVAGLKAKARLAELVRAGPVAIERHGTDRYRRTLARLRLEDGRVVGMVLVAEGLALLYRPGFQAHSDRTAHWCGPGRW